MGMFYFDDRMSNVSDITRCYTAPMTYSVIFCGTPEFAVPSLRALAEADGITVDMVITQPDRPAGRSRVLTAPPVKHAALELGLSILQPENVNTALPSLIQNNSLQRPDFLVVVAYGALLSQEVLDLPRIAPVNVHGSLLPRWRGASPVEHALLAGDSETGITVQRMVRALDAGPILASASTAILQDDTAQTLRQRLADMSSTLLPHTLLSPLEEREQDDTNVTICSKLRREDGIADPLLQSAEEIHRMVRALLPWPGVTLPLCGKQIKVLGASLSPVANSCELACKGGTVLYLTRVQEAGKTPMNAALWFKAQCSK